MKKIIVLFSLLIAFSCEDKNEEEVVNLNGTYKLNKDSWNCEGLEDIIYVTIQKSTGGITLTDYDYEGDACEDGTDCYGKDSYELVADGNGYKFLDYLKVEANGDGIKLIHIEDEGTYTENFDKESSDVKTFSPVCN